MKLWLDNFGWRSRRRHWPAGSRKARRRKEKGNFRVDVERLKRKVDRLYEKLDEAGIP